MSTNSGGLVVAVVSTGGDGNGGCAVLQHFQRHDMSTKVATRHRIKKAHRNTDKKIKLGFKSSKPSVTMIKTTKMRRNTLVKKTHQFMFSSSIIESTDPIDRLLRGTIPASVSGAGGL